MLELFFANAKYCEHDNSAINQKIPHARCRDDVCAVCVYIHTFLRACVIIYISCSIHANSGENSNTHAHTCTHTHTHTHAHAHTHTHIHTVYVSVCTQFCVSVCLRVCLRGRVCVCACARILHTPRPTNYSRSFWLVEESRKLTKRGAAREGSLKRLQLPLGLFCV